MSEWAHFQQLFAEFQLLYCRVETDLALFVKKKSKGDLDEVYMTGPKIDVIKPLSPDGWVDSSAPSDEGLMLLARPIDPWARLGIERGSPEGA